MSYNKHILFYVRSKNTNNEGNGDCLITDGKSSPSELDFKLSMNTLADAGSFKLDRGYKLAGALNKKYIVKVICGRAHSIFMTHAGMVFSLGNGAKGQLGLGDKTEEITEPTMITSLLNYRVIDVAIGEDHNIVYGGLRDTSKVKVDDVKVKENYIFVWGDNNYGQLGISESLGFENNFIYEPTQIEDIGNLQIKKIACGSNHTMVLLENGKLFGFGSNQYKQISNNFNETEVRKPSRIRFNQKLECTDVKCAAESTMIVTRSSKIIAFGKIASDSDTLKKIISIPEDVSIDDLIFLINDTDLVVIYDSAIIKEPLIQETDGEESNINQKESTIECPDTIVHHFATENTTEERQFSENEIYKDFLSDNASTNEIYDNNVSFEQSIEELRSYISLVGISLAGFIII